jgi:hypothetical protein
MKLNEYFFEEWTVRELDEMIEAIRDACPIVDCDEINTYHEEYGGVDAFMEKRTFTLRMGEVIKLDPKDLVKTLHLAGVPYHYMEEIITRVATCGRELDQKAKYYTPEEREQQYREYLSRNHGAADSDSLDQNRKRARAAESTEPVHQ